MSPACRAFEQRLAEALDRAGDGATAAAARDLSAADTHAAECPACALLATLVAGHAGVFAFLARPEPSPEFLSRLSETPADVRVAPGGLGNPLVSHAGGARAAGTLACAPEAVARRPRARAFRAPCGT